MKKKIKRKGPKRVVLRKRGEDPVEIELPRAFRVGKRARIKGRELLTVWLAKDLITVSPSGVPADPMKISHIMFDILRCYSAIYAGLLRPATEDEILGDIIGHFGELLGQLYPEELAEARAEAREERARMVAERQAAVEAPDLGGRPSKRRMH